MRVEPVFTMAVGQIGSDSVFVNRSAIKVSFTDPYEYNLILTDVPCHATEYALHNGHEYRAEI